MGFSFKITKRPDSFSWRRVLDRLIESVYLITVFLVPLWFAYFLPTYNIFEFNKMALFRILVSGLFGLTLLKIIFYPPRLTIAPRIFFKRYWLPPLIFIAGLGLSLIFSINPTQSFYGTLERQTGYSSYLFFFLWFILISFNILTVKNERIGRPEENDSSVRVAGNIRRIILAAVLSGTLVSVYAILQVLNIDFLFWPEPAYLTHRAFSSFGQPNFLASWLLLVIPLTVYLFFTSRSFLTRSFFLAAGVIQLVALFLSGSRGGLLALLATAALGLLYWLANTPWPKRRKILVGALFLFLALAAVGGLDVISHGRVHELADFRYGSLAARRQIYVSALDAISQKPFFGYGLENGNEVFIRYYDSDWGVYGNVNQTADRAHNLILDIWLSTGLFGLMLYGFLFFFSFRLIQISLRNGQNRPLVLALAAGATAYFISLFFSFTIVAGEIYLWFFLALLIANQVSSERLLIGSEKPDETADSFHFRYRLKLGATLFVIFITLVMISRAARDIIADYYFNQIYYSVARHDYFTALVLDSYLRGQKVNPVSQNSYDRFWGDNLGGIYPELTELTVKAALANKFEQADASLPAVGYKNLLAKAEMNIALENFSAADNYLSALLKISPFWPAAYLEAGRLNAARGNQTAALVDYYQALLNLPEPSDGRLNFEHQRDVLNFRRLANQRIADLYMTMSDYAAAEKYYRVAYRYQPANFSLLKNIADTYYLRGDLNSAIKYNERGFRRSPQDYHWPLALAALYRIKGDESQAGIYIEQARKLAPDSPELIAWPTASKATTSKATTSNLK